MKKLINFLTLEIVLCLTPLILVASYACMAQDKPDTTFIDTYGNSLWLAISLFLPIHYISDDRPNT